LFIKLSFKLLLFGLTFLLNPTQNYTDYPFTQVIAREIGVFVDNFGHLLIKTDDFVQIIVISAMTGL